MSQLTFEPDSGGQATIPRQLLDSLVALMGEDDVVFLLPLIESTPGAGGVVTDYTSHVHMNNVTDLDVDPFLKGSVLAWDLNGTDEYINHADDDYFSMGADGTTGNEPSFSIGLAVCLDDITGITLMSKFDATAASEQREWYFILNATSQILMNIYDESADTYIGRLTAAPAVTVGTWYIIIATYDGSQANSGVKIYRDGVQIDTGDSASGTYVAMENTTAIMFIGARENAGGAASAFLNGRVALPFITARELQLAEVQEITQIYRRLLGL